MAGVVQYSRRMTGSGVLRHLTALTLVGEGAMLITLVLGLIAFASVEEDGSLNLTVPPPALLLIMAVGAVFVAGAVGTWLQLHRSPRVAVVSTVLVASAVLANVVVVAVSVKNSTSLMTAVAGIALVFQGAQWWSTHRDRQPLPSTATPV